MRAWSGIIRLTTVLLPILILGFWGASYLVACAEYLANPGVPFRLTYIAPAGEITVTADSYVVDTKDGDITVLRPRVETSDGLLLFRADRVDALGLPLLNPQTRRAVITGRNAFATIKRKPDGALDLFDFLPKQEGPSGNFPFSVYLDQGQLRFIEMTGPEPYTQLLNVRNVNVDGVGDRWIASGAATLSRVGDVNLSVQNQPDAGVWVRGATDRLQLAELYRVFRETREGRNTRELRQINASSLVVHGPFELFIPSKAGARLQTRLVANAENFSYGRDYFADQVKFEGLISADGAQGKLTANTSGLDAIFHGTSSWQNGFTFGGDLDARATSTQALPAPIRRSIPSEFSASGPLEFLGKMAYSQPTGVLLNGKVNAGAVRGYGETITNPAIDLDYSKDRLALVARQGNWRGAPVVGQLAFDNRTRALAGQLDLDNVDLTGLARRFNINRVNGVGDLTLVLAGTVDKPVGYIRSQSRADFAILENERPRSGTLTLAAMIQDGKIQFQQAYLVTSSLSVAARGTYDLETQSLNLRAVGSGIDLDRWNPDLEGIARFETDITGTLSNPRFKGSGELFGLVIQGQPIPIITGQFQGDKNRILATDLKALKGASQAQGQVALNLRNMGLAGTFNASGVQLSDFLGDDYLATIDMTDARLGGTFSNPTFNATATAREIVIRENKVDSASAVVSYKNNLLQVDNVTAKVGEGQVEGFLSYNVARRAGEANFTARNLAVQNFVPPDIGATLTATLNGEAALTFNEQGFRRGSGEGTLTEIVLNQTPLGNGDWKVSADGNEVTGDLFFGGLTTSVDLTGFRYGMNDRSIDGNLWIRNAPVAEMYKIAQRYLPPLDMQLTKILEELSGTLGISADLGGTTDRIDIANGGFVAENLMIGEKSGGAIAAAFGRQDKLWTINSFKWEGGPVGLQTSGSFTESGNINLTGELYDADLSYVSLYEPSFASLSGKVNSSFSISGTTADPLVTATLNSSNAEGVGFIDNQGVKRNVFNFHTPSGPLQISNWKEGVGGLKGQIEANYQGYIGLVDLSLPFRFPFELVAGAPLAADLTMRERRVSDIGQLRDVFDPAVSEGTVSGQVSARGTKENVETIGAVKLNAPRLVFRQGRQEMRDVTAGFAFQPREMAVSVNGTSADGGTVTADALASIPTVDEILAQFRSGTLEIFWASPLSGTVATNDLSTRVKVGKDGVALGSVTSKLAIGGTLGNPALSGEVQLARAVLEMPSEFEEGEPTVWPNIPGAIDVTVRTTTPAKFKSSTADIDMVGGGTIKGTFDNLDADALLRVDRGQLRLPTARVNIEPGGTIRPMFALANGTSTARLEVELEGRTRVVTTKIGTGAQRYDVNLDVRGDLLQDGGLTLNATSDPPDLTQDEILALLGQVSLIQGIASGVQSGNAESQIRDAVFGIAVPYLLDPITSQLASAIGLDYLTLDISPLDGATIYFAKSLAKNLTLEGSRQVTQVNQNYPIKYDLRLSYLLRFGSRGDRRRLTFNVGLDEMRPWKIAVEYSFRF